MVTPVPQLRPFDVGAQYSRVGQAVESAAQAPMKGIQQFQQVKQAGLEGEATQLALDEKRSEIEALAESGKRFEAAKKELAAEVLGGEENFNMAFSPKGEVRGRVPAGPEMPDAEARKAPTGAAPYSNSQFTLAKRIMGAENKSELGVLMSNARKIISSYEEHNKKYGASVAVPAPNFDEMQVFMDEDGKPQMPYAETYKGQLTKQKDTYFREGVQRIINEELKGATPDPKTKLLNIDEKQVLRKVFKDPDFSEMAYDKPTVQLVKDMFHSRMDELNLKMRQRESDVRMAEAKRRKEKSETKTSPEVINNELLMAATDKMSKLSDKIMKQYKLDKASLDDPGQYLRSKEFEALSAKQQGEVSTLLKNRQKWSRITKMAKAGQDFGIALDQLKAERIMDDVLDADGPTSEEAKQFAPILGITPKEKVDEGAGVGEGEGAEARTFTDPKQTQAFDWAKANPTDPRARQVLEKLGLSEEEINTELGT